MKTHIIQLDEYDDLVSARDKMGWASGERILLIWPERAAARRAGVLSRRLDILLLQRRAAELGAQLGIVTGDRAARAAALRLGIPVFKNVRQAQAPTWRLPRRFRSHPVENPPWKAAPEQPRPRPERLADESRPLNQLQRLLIFSCGVLAVLLLAATLAPQAAIRLTPQTRVQEVLLDAWSGPQAAQVDLAGSVPSQWAMVTVEGRDTLPTRGSLRLPDQPAQGQVRFTNLTDRPVEIPAGTVVRSPGERAQRFGVTRAGTLPAGPGTTADLPVTALAPGSAGNLPAGSLVAVEGPIGAQAAADNPQPTHSGADRVEPAPSAADYQALAERLDLALQQTALNELQASLAPGDLLLPDSLELVRVIEQQYQPAQAGSDPTEQQLPADRLSLHRRLELRARLVRDDDLRRLVQGVFDANLPGGFTPLNESLRWQVYTPPAPDGAGSYRWQLAASRQLIAETSPETAIQSVLGAGLGQAGARLQHSLHLEEPPVISMQPAWWPVMPVLPFRITVTLNTPPTPAQPGALAPAAP